MKTIIAALFLFCLVACDTNIEPGLKQGWFYTEQEGRDELVRLEKMYSSKRKWEKRRKMLRKEILKGMNLDPLPMREPLNPVFRFTRIKNGYSVENVAFESIPGLYVCGNLYRPLDDSDKHPAILCTHGHFQGDSLIAWGRFNPAQQRRCATLARMGAVIFNYSMFAYAGEHLRQLNPETSLELPDKSLIDKFHKIPLALTMQTWNSMRAIDFLETLPDVDPSRIGITGASGGGTQSFLLSALDDRISLSIPTVMISCHFFGGCTCESGLPIHQGRKHFTNNAEIAAIFAPKPMLIISDGADWTKNTPEVEYPFIKRTYSFYNAEDMVENAHFPDGVHDYSYPKRLPAYAFVAKHFGLDLESVTGSDGSIDEEPSEVESPDIMLVFSDSIPFPPHALKDLTAIEERLKELQ
jgi:dienelactone hydrolase